MIQDAHSPIISEAPSRVAAAVATDSEHSEIDLSRSQFPHSVSSQPETELGVIVHFKDDTYPNFQGTVQYPVFHKAIGPTDFDLLEGDLRRFFNDIDHDRIPRPAMKSSLESLERERIDIDNKSPALKSVLADYLNYVARHKPEFDSEIMSRVVGLSYPYDNYLTYAQLLPLVSQQCQEVIIDKFRSVFQFLLPEQLSPVLAAIDILAQDVSFDTLLSAFTGCVFPSVDASAIRDELAKRPCSSKTFSLFQRIIELEARSDNYRSNLVNFAVSILLVDESKDYSTLFLQLLNNRRVDPQTFSALSKYFEIKGIDCTNVLERVADENIYPDVRAAAAVDLLRIDFDRYQGVMSPVNRRAYGPGFLETIDPCLVDGRRREELFHAEQRRETNLAYASSLAESLDPQIVAYALKQYGFGQLMDNLGDSFLYGLSRLRASLTWDSKRQALRKISSYLFLPSQEKSLFRSAVRTLVQSGDTESIAFLRKQHRSWSAQISDQIFGGRNITFKGRCDIIDAVFKECNLAL